MSEPVVTYADDYDIHPKEHTGTWPAAPVETKVVTAKHQKATPTSSAVAETK